MTFRLRAARSADLEALYEMAKLTGGGFTNLPPERAALKAKLDRAEAAFGTDSDTIADELFVLVLENRHVHLLKLLNVRWFNGAIGSF